MESQKFDNKKLIEEMKTLRDKRITDIKAINLQKGIEKDETKLANQITVKYLGKMEFVNETGEMIEKDVFMTVEHIDGQFQIRYYDSEQNLLGIQQGIDTNIMLSTDLSSKTIEEQHKIQKELEEKDKDEAKTLEELEEEQKNQEEQAETVSNNEPQLTQTQVNRLKGPKAELNQILDGITLAEAIGLDGQYMQLIDADEARRLIPDLHIPTSQRTIPIEIFSNGSANVIGEDKLKYSTIEGTNSTEEHVTRTNEGETRIEQNIETFNIVNKGEMHTIAIGFDENNNGMPLEMKYGIRDVEEPTKIAYSELETLHEGPIEQDDKTQQYAQDDSEGIYKADQSMEDVVEEYARRMNIREVDEHGYPTSEYDLEAAKQQLEERWAENPDASLDELIEEEQKQPGPQDNRRW